MSQIYVDNIRNRTGGAIGAPAGIDVTGVSTITGDLKITGLLTYEDVNNVDSVGIITARQGIISLGSINITGSDNGIVSAGVVTASSFDGDGSSLTGIAADKIFEGNTKAEVVDTGSNGHFLVETEGVERLRIDSAGRMLLGTTAAGSNGTADDLVVANNGSASDQAGITIRGGTSGRSQIFFSDGTSGDAEYRGMLRYDHSDESMQFRTAATERLRIASDGAITINAVPGTNNNASQAVLFQTAAGIIDGGSGLTYNPAQDVLSVNGLICGSQIVRTTGANQLTLTTANGNGQSDIRINAASVALVGGGTVRLEVNPSGVVNTGVTTFSGTSHIKVPVGTTAQRPSVGGAGDFRYNSTTGGFEGYTNEWGAVGGSAGFTTEAQVKTNGQTATLNIASAQDHKVTCTGTVTIDAEGGTADTNEGESHTIRIINNGSSTVGFSTFFLFPSGAAPSLPTVDGAVSLISFTVNRVGAGGTQLLAGASVNYS